MGQGSPWLVLGAHVRDLYLGVLHGLHGALESRPQGGKADEHVHLGMLLHGVGHVLVDRDQDLLVAPVELLLVVPTGIQQAGHEKSDLFVLCILLLYIIIVSSSSFVVH